MLRSRLFPRAAACGSTPRNAQNPIGSLQLTGNSAGYKAGPLDCGGSGAVSLLPYEMPGIAAPSDVGEESGGGGKRRGTDGLFGSGGGSGGMVIGTDAGTLAGSLSGAVGGTFTGAVGGRLGSLGGVTTRTPAAMGFEATRAWAMVLCKYTIQRRAASMVGSAPSAIVNCCRAAGNWPFFFSRYPRL